MLPNNFHCPSSTGGRQITMPMHRYKPQAESPEAKCPRLALIGCRMQSRALRKLQTHTIAPKGHRKGQVRSHLIVDVLCHPKSALKARARANGTGVDVGGQGERSKPWGAGTVIRRHYFRLSPVCGSIAWAGLSQLQCLPIASCTSQGPCLTGRTEEDRSFLCCIQCTVDCSIIEPRQTFAVTLPPLRKSMSPFSAVL